MSRFRIRLIVPIFLLILFTSLSFLFFLLRISDNISNVDVADELRNVILLSGLIITALAIVLAVLFSLFLADRITIPISELVKATVAISKKDFDQKVKVRAYSEIEELISSFNQMSEQLKNYEQEAQRHSQDLECVAKERAKELSYIYRIGREVSSTLELSEVLDTITTRISEVLDLKVCIVLLVDEIFNDRMKVLHAQGINLKKVEKQALKKGEGISGWVWQKKEPLLIEDLDQDERFIGRRKERYYSGSLISTPLEAKDRIIGVINGNNKVSGQVFKENDLLLLQEIAAESAIAIENALLYKSLKKVYVHTISALARALEAKDHYSLSHSENVTKYAVAIAQELGLSSSQVEAIRQACLLHDLGKIGIHDYILTKPGKLSAEEWEEVKLHSLRGAQILKPIDFLSETCNLISQHHERYDGKGYPYSLSGQDIELGARIMAVADAFDAMSSERPYRKALTLAQAKTELRNNSGTQFDPGIVKVFLKVLEAEPGLTNK